MSARPIDRRSLLRAGLVGLAAACTGQDLPSAGPGPDRTGGTGTSSDPSTTNPGTTAPAAAPAEPTDPTRATATAATVHLLCREAWQARPARSGTTRHQLDRLTLHHTAVVAEDDTQGPSHLRLYQDRHMDQLGWADIAYHVAIDRAGYAYELRDWRRVGATGTDYDPAGHFLLVLDGNFQEQEPDPRQLDTAAHVLAWGADRFDVGLDTLVGHRELAVTACPGDALQRRIGALHQRGRELAARGVQLVPVCGKQGRRTVEAISAGTSPEVPPLA